MIEEVHSSIGSCREGRGKKEEEGGKKTEGEKVTKNMRGIRKWRAVDSSYSMGMKTSRMVGLVLGWIVEQAKRFSQFQLILHPLIHPPADTKHPTPSTE